MEQLPSMHGIDAQATAWYQETFHCKYINPAPEYSLRPWQVGADTPLSAIAPVPFIVLEVWFKMTHGSILFRSVYQTNAWLSSVLLDSHAKSPFRHIWWPILSGTQEGRFFSLSFTTICPPVWFHGSILFDYATQQTFWIFIYSDTLPCNN